MAPILLFVIPTNVMRVQIKYFTTFPNLALENFTVGNQLIILSMPIYTAIDIPHSMIPRASWNRVAGDKGATSGIYSNDLILVLDKTGSKLLQYHQIKPYPSPSSHSWSDMNTPRANPTPVNTFHTPTSRSRV